MLHFHPDLFEAIGKAVVATIEPRRPRVTGADQWPPDYRAIYAWRLEQLSKLRSGELPIAGALAYYRQPEHWREFIMDWMDTYDPRRTDTKWIPFVLFPRQADFIDLIIELIDTQESGLIEKCRDMGITWCAVAITVCIWLFVPGFAIGWGSRREDLVDQLGIPDSIFEKVRLTIRRLPGEFLPEGFSDKDNLTFMRCINPESGATIAGEVGDNIGRGGRKGLYLKDESAHYERPMKIEAALSATTNVQVDISSVNGFGNPFHKRRQAGVDWEPGAELEPGKTRVLVFDWRDDPRKNQEWYDRTKAKWEAEGMPHIFAQEYERNYSAALSNLIISSEWIKAAINAHLKIEGMEGPWHAGFDIADDGGDTNAMIARQGVILRKADEWSSRDPGVSARKAIAMLVALDNGPNNSVVCEYDMIGMGTNVKSEWNRLTEHDAATKPIIDVGNRYMNPWNAGGKIQWPNKRIIPDDPKSPINAEFYGNLKAQGWYSLRNRFLKTWQAINQGIVHDPSILISLDAASIGTALLRKIEQELAQPTEGRNGAMKVIVDKKPDGAKSPNLGDAAMMCYFPAETGGSSPLVGHYGS